MSATRQRQLGTTIFALRPFSIVKNKHWHHFKKKSNSTLVSYRTTKSHAERLRNAWRLVTAKVGSLGKLRFSSVTTAMAARINCAVVCNTQEYNSEHHLERTKKNNFCKWRNTVATVQLYIWPGLATIELMSAANSWPRRVLMVDHKRSSLLLDSSVDVFAFSKKNLEPFT